MEEQNLNEQVTTDTATAGAEVLEGGKMAVSSLGKFNDAESLLKAYNSLEAEFTRRSQKLKELEGVSENLKKEPLSRDNDINYQAENFIQRFPEAKSMIKAISEKAVKNGEFKDGFLEKAYLEVMEDNLQNIEKKYNSEEFLNEKIKSNEKLKEQIIRDYFQEIKLSKSNVNLLGSGGLTITAPPLKPRTLDEVRGLALEFLTKK